MRIDQLAAWLALTVMLCFGGVVQVRAQVANAIVLDTCGSITYQSHQSAQPETQDVHGRKCITADQSTPAPVTCVSGCGLITNYFQESGGNADLMTSYLLALKNAIGSPIPAQSSCQTTALAGSLVCGAAGARTIADFTVTADGTLDAAAWYVMIFDATALPSNGAVTPFKCYQVPSGQAQFGGTFAAGGVANPTSTGLVIGVSTTGCFTLTTSAHALFIGASYQ